MAEPEDSMKWWIVRRRPGVFDFHEGDEIVRFAQAHEMKVRGHCLVWDHDNPKWLSTANFTPPQLAHLLQEHIATVMKHYAGQVFAWDVVNEAFEEHGKLKDSIWFNQPGIGFSGQGAAYIEQAFRWARDADPKALLFYNEAEAEGMNPKSDAVYGTIRDFKQRGVPIDGVGLQLHISHPDFDTKPLAENIARLTALGIQVHITEFDVSLPDASGQIRDSDLQRQAAIYRGVVHACLQNPGCTAIQTWGFTDKYSWIGSHSHGTRGGALLFDKNYKPKPSYASALEEISSQPSRGR
jgi:endo-1,4-beta-xylanase